MVNYFIIIITTKPKGASFSRGCSKELNAITNQQILAATSLSTLGRWLGLGPNENTNFHYCR
jgi:hypothetical protein